MKENKKREGRKKEERKGKCSLCLLTLLLLAFFSEKWLNDLSTIKELRTIGN